MLEVHPVVVTPFLQNCTVLVCSETGAAMVCDPGEAEPVLRRVRDMGVEAAAILATHGHLDHIGGAAELARALRAPFWYPRGDDFWRLRLPQQAAAWGLPPAEVPEVDRELRAGDVLTLGRERLEVLHCPGHTPGHVCFHAPDSELVLAGDVLFRGSVGRTDFPGGSWPQLQRSIQEQLYRLPPRTRVFCGHGPETTIAEEAATNPFVRADSAPC